MQNFIYYAPTKIVFGKETELQAGSLVREYGGTKVLVHFGGGSARRSGLLDRVCASLEKEGIPYVTLGGVQPNPRLSKVHEGIALGVKEGVDFILAVGGGSVIDSSKAIGYGIAYPDREVWDIYENKFKPEKCAPIGVILTIAAAGSEMSNSAVITNEDGWIKRGRSFDVCRPKFAVLNPELTYTLPPYQTASGCTDIMMHTMERYFQKEPLLAITDRMAESLMKDTMKNAKILVKEPENYEARAEIMWCGSLSHNGLMNCGGTRGDWSSHQLEHELSAKYDVAHGAGLAAVWSSWARYVLPENPHRFAQFAVSVMDVNPDGFRDENALGLRGIEAVENFYHEIGMPSSIRELKLAPTEDDLKDLASRCAANSGGAIGTQGIRALKKEDILKIYRMAL